MRSNILVVDDDEKVLEILKKSLRNKGHSVRLARDGGEALDIYNDELPDMVILDLMLPDMDGRDVFKQMRSVPGSTSVPVLFLSASSDPGAHVRSLDSGAEDFITKPFSLREFNAKVRKILRAYRTKRELEEERASLESEVNERQQSNAQINKELQRQLLAMKTLFAVSQDLNRRLDVDELLNGLALTLIGELQLSSMAVFLTSRNEDGYLRLHGLKGFDRSRIADVKIEIASDFIVHLMEKQGPQKIVRTKNNSWVNKLPDVRLALFEYVTPITVKQEIKGVVFTGPKLSVNDYNRYDLSMLKSICNSAGIGLENARLFGELQATYLSTVKALVSIIEAKDAYTRGHTERVADYSVALGAKMELSKDELRNLAFGAVLHDIGKLLVHERILNKPGSLDDHESDVLRQHPEIGAGIIENMPFLSGTVPLVRHHHECYDGAGYPDGLLGDDIPIGARIIAVSDAFDAMTTHRPYRKALSWKTALGTLKSKAGSQFDPEVVNNFIDLVDIDGFRPRSFSEFSVAEKV